MLLCYALCWYNMLFSPSTWFKSVASLSCPWYKRFIKFEKKHIPHACCSGFKMYSHIKFEVDILIPCYSSNGANYEPDLHLYWRILVHYENYKSFSCSWNTLVAGGHTNRMTCRSWWKHNTQPKGSNASPHWAKYRVDI